MNGWPLVLVLLAGGLSGVGGYVAAGLAHWAWRRRRAAAAGWPPPLVPPDPGGLDPASERLWDQFDRPGPPYPDWYRPENDPAAPFGAQHGAGAVRYFARNMHDHRRGPKHCPACQGQL